MITPLAWVVAFILFIGFMSNIFIGIQSIDTLARLIHNEEIDRTLAAHLDRIKQIHTLKQQLLLEKIRPYISSWRSQNHKPVPKATIQNWLNSAGSSMFPQVTIAMIEEIPQDTIKERGATLNWRSKEDLQVLNFLIHFPKSSLYESFTEVTEIRQRYHLMGTALFEQIRPKLIQANAAVLVISFLILTFCLFFFIRRLQINLQEILSGFESWRKNNFDFRFTQTFPGELGVITRQFNAMAIDIKKNRQKSLYLEKVASWQVIARKLAHEIKNPLTPIQMMVSQLTRFYKGDDQKFKDILHKAQKIITEEVNGLRLMVDHFSNFARLPESFPEIKNIVPIITHTVELQQAAFPHHKISYTGSLKEVEVSIDENLIRQVLNNLIKNAAEACVGQQASIEIFLDEKQKFYTIYVHDNGPGIPEAIKKRVFEAYFTTKHTGPSPGMGLGLAICQKIVLDHGSVLTVESQKGNTVFTFDLAKEKHES